MMNIDNKMPLMITWATGSFAGWIVKKPFDEGRTVCLNTELRLQGEALPV